MSDNYHNDVPIDENGYPIHPDPGVDYHICGRGKSQDRPPSKNGEDRDDVEYCCLPAGWGTDDAGTAGNACKLHGGASLSGKSAPSYEHGEYAPGGASDD